MSAVTTVLVIVGALTIAAAFGAVVGALSYLAEKLIRKAVSR